LFPNWDKGINQIFGAIDIEINLEKESQENEKQDEEEKWRMGLSDKDWKDSLTNICKKNAFPL
jgi:hypothetical protein